MASQFQLIMRSGPTPGAAFTLEGDQLTIGDDCGRGCRICDGRHMCIKLTAGIRGILLVDSNEFRKEVVRDVLHVVLEKHRR